MSTILDALERAEQERNARGAAPVHKPLARPQRLWQRPVVWLFGSGLLLLNLLVWWLMLDEEAPAPVAEVQPAPAAPAPEPKAPPAKPREAVPLAPARTSVSSLAPKPLEPIERKPERVVAAVPAPAKLPVPPLLDEAAVRPVPVSPPSVAQPAAVAPVVKAAGDLASQIPAEPRVESRAKPSKPLAEAVATATKSPPVTIAKLNPPVVPKAPAPVEQAALKPVLERPEEKPASTASELPSVTSEKPPAPPQTEASVSSEKPLAVIPESLAKARIAVEKKPPAVVKPKVRKPAAKKPVEVVVEQEEPRIPAIWQLPEKTQKKLKGLKINIHVYNEVPDERFVIIDMHRYREGDSLDRPGLTLESITRDGVIIDYGKGKVRF